jgi:kynurenine formamidase
MKHIDAPVPLDATLATYPNNTPSTLEPIRRLARGDNAVLSTLHRSAHAGTRVDAARHFIAIGGVNLRDAELGLYDMSCLRPHIVDFGGAPACVVSSRA